MVLNEIMALPIGTSENTLRTVLEAIIAARLPVIHRLHNETIYVTTAILIVHTLISREQSVFKLGNELLASREAGQVWLAHEHHLNKDDNLLSVSLEGLETASHPLSEVTERGWALATHNVKHLLSQFERRRLEFDSLARCVWEQESKVNMEHMAFNINQDVLIMSIFDLENIAN